MLTIDKAREIFHEHCRIGITLSTNTIKAYDRDLADFSSFVGGELKVGEVGRDLLRSFARRLFDEQGPKEASVKRRIATLKVFFRWLEREEMVEITPFHRLDLVVRLPRRLPRGLSAEELRASFEFLRSGLSPDSSLLSSPLPPIPLFPLTFPPTSRRR